jgi:hypothetical protein
VCRRRIKPKQAYITSSGPLKGIKLRKSQHGMFTWDKYQPENAESFYVA